MANFENLIGKHILVGLTYLNTEGEIASQVQLHGTITRIEEFVLNFDRADGEGEFSLPYEKGVCEPDPGQPGAVYTLKATGEKVTDVDYLCSFTINPPEEDCEPRNTADG